MLLTTDAFANLARSLARAQGLPVETLMSEYAPGQFELTLAHRDDALRAVDAAATAPTTRDLLRSLAAAATRRRV